jgi:hypothetical protein
VGVAAYAKLIACRNTQVFDAGASFRVEQLADGTRRAVCIAPGGLAAGGDVFLVRARAACAARNGFFLRSHASPNNCV